MKTFDEAQKKNESERKFKEKLRKKPEKRIEYDREISDPDIAEYEPFVAEGPYTGDRPGE